MSAPSVLMSARTAPTSQFLFQACVTPCRFCTWMPTATNVVTVLQFCSYDSAPYKTKLTIFSLQEDFDDSTNSGFFVQEDSVQMRFGGEIYNLNINAEGVVGGEVPEGAEEICKVLSHIHREYRYLLGPVLP